VVTITSVDFPHTKPNFSLVLNSGLRVAKFIIFETNICINSGSFGGGCTSAVCLTAERISDHDTWNDRACSYHNTLSSQPQCHGVFGVHSGLRIILIKWNCFLLLHLQAKYNMFRTCFRCCGLFALEIHSDESFITRKNKREVFLNNKIAISKKQTEFCAIKYSFETNEIDIKRYFNVLNI
jgi:hypothetical protein